MFALALFGTFGVRCRSRPRAARCVWAIYPATVHAPLDLQYDPPHFHVQVPSELYALLVYSSLTLLNHDIHVEFFLVYNSSPVEPAISPILSPNPSCFNKVSILLHPDSIFFQASSFPQNSIRSTWVLTCRFITFIAISAIT